MSRRRAPCLDTYLDKVKRTRATSSVDARLFSDVPSRPTTQVNLMLWPRFKAVFDAHLASVKAASDRALMPDDVQGHYIVRRFADFAASAHPLTAVHGDGQLEQNMVRRAAAS